MEPPTLTIRPNRPIPDLGVTFWHPRDPRVHGPALFLKVTSLHARVDRGAGPWHPWPRRLSLSASPVAVRGSSPVAGSEARHLLRG
jgi:hypothetical protein